MKIKNNTITNHSVFGVSTRGSAIKNTLTVIAESTLELDDALWLKEFANPAQNLIKAGHLVITKAPVKSDEEVAVDKADALKSARKLIAEEAAEKKAVAEAKANKAS